MSVTTSIIQQESDLSLVIHSTELAQEADYFHQQLFGFQIPGEIQKQYLEAYTSLFQNSPLDETQRFISQLINHKGDLEAVELALRRKNPKNLLTQKVHILLYLVENDSRYYRRFYNQDSFHFVKAWGLLFFGGLKSLYKLIYGKWWLWRNSLV